MSNDMLTGLRLDARAVQGSTRPGTAAGAATGGKVLPSAGQESPPAPRVPEIRLPEQADLSRVVEKLNEFLRQSARSLQFHYDQSSGRTVITVVDAATGEVVRQIPSDELLAIAERLQVAGQSGALVDLRT